MTNSQSKGLEAKQNKRAATENSDFNSGEDVEKLDYLCPDGRNVEFWRRLRETESPMS